MFGAPRFPPLWNRHPFDLNDNELLESLRELPLTQSAAHMKGSLQYSFDHFGPRAQPTGYVSKWRTVLVQSPFFSLGCWLGVGLDQINSYSVHAGFSGLEAPGHEHFLVYLETLYT